MEEAPNQQDEDEQMNLMNFSYSKHGFEYNYKREFEFDDGFTDLDKGQLQSQPTALDEQDLLSRLRNKEKRDTQRIPPTIYEFYDNCKAHFCGEFISLLTGLFSNLETTRKLREHNSETRLLEFFNIKLCGQLNFGKNQVFVDCAAECDAEIKAKLRECGKDIQLLVQAGREKATATASIELKACSENFTIFGEKNG